MTPLSQPKRVAFAVVLPSWQGQQGIGVAASESQRRSVAALSTFFYELSLAFENCMFGRHYPYFQPKAGNPESAFIHVQCAFPHKDENDFSQTNASRHFLKSSGSGSGGGVHFPDTLLHCLHHYKTGVIQAVRKALSERGVAMPDGHCSPILAPFAGQQEKSSPGPLVIASKSGPLNGQGPLTTAFDFYRGTELDVHLVIYLVEPFTQHFDMDDELRNLTTRCMAEAASRMVAQLPASWRQRVSVQLLPMAHITSPRCGLVSGHDGEGTADFLPHVKSMALAVYTSVDRVISPSLINANRTLTGMGPAAEKEVISANFESVHIRRVYSPAYTLAQSHDLWGQWDMHPAEPLQPSSVLFVSYCLSEDQQWLLATCTDQYGTLSQQTFINIRTPESMCTPSGVTVNKSNTATDTSHISARRLALARLWDFIISLLATTSNPWRLVIGRLGRLGHGELRGWCGLLSRKNLQNVNRSLRANCALCNLVTLVPSTSNNNGPSYRGRSTATISLTADSRVPSSCVHETPSLISACLVSTEPHSTFRLFPGSDLNTGDFGGPGGHGSSSHGGGGGGSGGVGGGSGASVSSGSGGVGSGPAGQVPAGPFANGVISAAGYAPSTTHILVFPTSTSAQAQSEQDDINFTEIFGDFYEENEFDDHAAVGMPSLDTLTTPNSAGPGCNLASAVVGGVGGVGPCSGVPQDPNGGGTGLLISSLMRGDVPVEPNTQGMPYEAACRERAKFLLESLLPFGVPDPQSEKPSLMQQPLALGYHVSTAPAGPLPSWFWAACQQTRRNSPVCLKSSLHLHCTLVGVDDDAAAHGGQQCSSNSANAGSHLLDSNVTCDVLRFVLECYNALSWLSYDPCINDRRSCLPVHMLSLAQLYQAAKAFT
ncbi:unnamed protein product [Mesocestoides corti]|uniref:Mediator of RNA polymerase II transcription subunit 13 n=2 Tax=Mesocestoides corti TaxID=53468 RepID=A0A3P6HFY3_MESCO|nr:unnamed protein product [Mesocestoides corti]